jgi:shikimate dehydrogenase
MIKACVIGWPIAHSRSPLIHNYWIDLHGIQGRYDKVAVEPASLSQFFQNLRRADYTGCNVTIPHKENAAAFVDEADDRVRRIGALNTVWLQGDKLHATSTDGPGFISNVFDHCPGFDCTGATIAILGAGGSARSLVDELLRQGVERIYIHNRTPERAEQLSQHFGKTVIAVDAQKIQQALATSDLLINTTPQGMNNDQQVDIPWQVLNEKAIVADIVYTPLVTPFLQTAKSRGHVIVPGLGMLLHQAVIGFEKWFGVRPEVTSELHTLVARDIDPDHQP